LLRGAVAGPADFLLGADGRLIYKWSALVELPHMNSPIDLNSAIFRSLVRLSFALVLAVFVAGCEQDSTPETLFADDYDKGDMESAIENAQAHVDDFIEILQSGEVEDYSIKVEMSDGENTEHFWTSDVAYADGTFIAKIGNDAGLVEGVSLGDEVTRAKDEISDWLYIKDGLMHGNFTMRVLLPGMDPEESEMWKSRMAPLPE
jgi:uncharacterized protein YegJ (DUF2314 family)